MTLTKNDMISILGEDMGLAVGTIDESVERVIGIIESTLEAGQEAMISC